MPTREFEIARSKPKWVVDKVINGITKKKYFVEEKITKQEWRDFVDNNQDLNWTPNEEKRKMIAEYKWVIIDGKRNSDWQISEGMAGDLKVLMWKKNKEGVDFIHKMAEHFGAKLYKMTKEYELK
jgi:hypothetical protein